MRRAREVYQKRKELVKKRIKGEVSRRLSVCPRNCQFNQRVSLDGNGMKTSLCLYGQPLNKKGEPFDASKIIVCNTVKQAKECSARIPLYTNAVEVEKKIKEELQDPKVRMNKFSDLVALDWVLDTELHAIKADPTTKFQKLMLWFASKFENWARPRKSK